MCLPIHEVDHFYGIWRPLLRFANDRLKVVKSLSGKGPPDNIVGKPAVKVRDALWKNEMVLDQFIDENPAQFSPEDLNILRSWKYRRQGFFIIYKILKKHAIFISQDKAADVFAVKGLYNTYEEIFGSDFPRLVETVLLPFNGEIITDGLLPSYDLLFGSGIRSEFKAIYDDAKELGTIITTLLPALPASRENKVGKVQKTNAKVLDDFEKYLFSSGLSPKIVQRDVSVIADFAQAVLIQQPEPASLRDFGEKDLQDYLRIVPEPVRKQVNLSLKRFISFLRESGRLDWAEAEDLLDVLKSAM